MTKKKFVLGVTGATGAILSLRILQVLKTFQDIETHLIVSPAGLLTIKHELKIDRKEFCSFADVTHSFRDVGNILASGSVKTLGMAIVPCSMKTLASCAYGLSDNLIARAADVHLKERRKLLLAVRETPFNLAHLRNMTAVTEMGGVIFPPLPAFYNNPQSIDDMVNQTVARMLDQFGLECPDLKEWQGLI